MQKPYKIKHHSIDFLRVIAIMSVVGIHTSIVTLQESNHNITEFTSTLFWNQALRFAVPVFFIITGFLAEANYHKYESYWHYFQKRLAKILLPYVFWSSIYYYFIYRVHYMNFIEALLTGEAAYHLYFIPTLLVYYAIYPLVHKFRIFILNSFIIFLLFMFQVVLLSWDYYVKPIDLTHPFNYVLLTYFYFLFGVYFFQNKDMLKTYFYKISSLIPFLLLFLGIYIFLEGKNNYSQTENYLSFYSQWRPSVLIYSTILFTFIYYKYASNLKIEKLISVLSSQSFTVYFVHIIVLDYSWLLFGNSLFNQLKFSYPGRVIFDLLFFVSVLFVSFAFAFISRKIHFLTRITG